MRHAFATVAALALLVGPASAQPAPGQPSMGAPPQGGPMHEQPGPNGTHRMPMQGPGMHDMAMRHHADAPMGKMGSVPTQPGQGAFGAVQEIVRILEADPSTDWSKVNLDALRGHLIDMEEVTLHVDAVVEHIPGGIQVAVTGKGRTLEAIRSM